MGCHTWFARPVTNTEFEVFRNNAIADAKYLFWEDYIDEYYRVKCSVEYNTDYWWQYGFGTTIRNGLEEKSEHTYVIDGIMYLDLSKPVNPIFPELKRYHDVFRVKNYPLKKIHSRYELRKWMGKKYFGLNKQQLNKISEFFRDNPNGIITFG